VMPVISILEALDDPELFQPLFAAPTWDRWKSFLAALFALPLTGEAREHYREHTGRTVAPIKAFREAAIVCGRRGPRPPPALGTDHRGDAGGASRRAVSGDGHLLPSGS